jgi:hypothetical protein
MLLNQLSFAFLLSAILNRLIASVFLLHKVDVRSVSREQVLVYFFDSFRLKISLWSLPVFGRKPFASHNHDAFLTRIPPILSIIKN